MNIAVVTAYDLTYDVGPLIRPNKQAYCDKYGYDFHCFTDNSLFSHCWGNNPYAHRYLHWVKFFAIAKVWDKYDWVFWTDADSVITNPEISLESFINNEKILIVPQTAGREITTGNFFVRHCCLTQVVFDEIWQRDEWSTMPDAALNGFLQENPFLRRHIKVVSSRALNSWHESGPNQYQRGDFMLHFLRTGPSRLELVKQLLASLK